jgi:hypothetical protein
MYTHTPICSVSEWLIQLWYGTFNDEQNSCSHIMINTCIGTLKFCQGSHIYPPSWGGNSYMYMTAAENPVPVQSTCKNIVMQRHVMRTVTHINSQCFCMSQVMLVWNCFVAMNTATHVWIILTHSVCHSLMLCSKNCTVVELKGVTAWASSIHIPFLQPSCLRHILISTSHVLLGLQIGHFPSSPCRILSAFLNCILAICPAQHSVLYFCILTLLYDLHGSHCFSLCFNVVYNN